MSGLFTGCVLAGVASTVTRRLEPGLKLNLKQLLLRLLLSSLTGAASAAASPSSAAVAEEKLNLKPLLPPVVVVLPLPHSPELFVDVEVDFLKN